MSLVGYRSVVSFSMWLCGLIASNCLVRATWLDKVAVDKRVMQLAVKMSRAMYIRCSHTPHSYRFHRCVLCSAGSCTTKAQHQIVSLAKKGHKPIKIRNSLLRVWQPWGVSWLPCPKAPLIKLSGPLAWGLRLELQLLWSVYKSNLLVFYCRVPNYFATSSFCSLNLFLCAFFFCFYIQPIFCAGVIWQWCFWWDRNSRSIGVSMRTKQASWETVVLRRYGL